MSFRENFLSGLRELRIDMRITSVEELDHKILVLWNERNQDYQWSRRVDSVSQVLDLSRQNRSDYEYLRNIASAMDIVIEDKNIFFFCKQEGNPRALLERENLRKNLAIYIRLKNEIELGRPETVLRQDSQNEQPSISSPSEILPDRLKRRISNLLDQRSRRRLEELDSRLQNYRERLEQYLSSYQNLLVDYSSCRQERDIYQNGLQNSSENCNFLEEGIEKIKQAGQFKDVQVIVTPSNETPYIWARTTEEVTLNYSVDEDDCEEEGDDESVDLGYFAVCINLIDFSVRVYPIYKNAFVSDSGHYHPHVSDGGNMCWGDGAEFYHAFIDNREIAGIFTLIGSILHNYNWRSPYVTCLRMSNAGISMNTSDLQLSVRRMSSRGMPYRFSDIKRDYDNQQQESSETNG